LSDRTVKLCSRPEESIETRDYDLVGPRFCRSRVEGELRVLAVTAADARRKATLREAALRTGSRISAGESAAASMAPVRFTLPVELC
jgi:hypothetical protein